MDETVFRLSVRGRSAGRARGSLNIDRARREADVARDGAVLVRPRRPEQPLVFDAQISLDANRYARSGKPLADGLARVDDADRPISSLYELR